MAMKRYLPIFVALLLSGCGAAGWLLVRNPISQEDWDRIHQGMTKEEVIKILGPPKRYDLFGAQFEYWRFMNAGWVEFNFGPDGRLLSKNDESVNASLR